jgi:hypothetical protein
MEEPQQEQQHVQQQLLQQQPQQHHHHHHQQQQQQPLQASVVSAVAPTAPYAPPTGVKKTFYKRKLPCPPATEFSSAEGTASSRSLLFMALTCNNLLNYLMNQPTISSPCSLCLSQHFVVELAMQKGHALVW